MILRLCAGGEIQEPLSILALEQKKPKPNPQWRFQACWGGGGGGTRVAWLPKARGGHREPEIDADRELLSASMPTKCDLP